MKEKRKALKKEGKQPIVEEDDAEMVKTSIMAINSIIRIEFYRLLLCALHLNWGFG